MNQNYDPKLVEAQIYKLWQEQQIGNPDLQKNINSKKVNSILMPPPNLTGDLHAGHSFQHYLMDTLSRIARQQGQKNLWLPGVDHAGLQLEGVIDKLIRKGEFDDKIMPFISLSQGLGAIAKEDLPKYLKTNYPDLWLECAWSKVNLWRDNQKNQASVLGDTPDYARSLFTLDKQNLDMVNYAFEKYWKDGLIYKGSYLVSWSVELQTALSDVAGEVDYEKRIDPFVTFEYRLFDGQDNFLGKSILVATVRPETVFGDYAVAVHPIVFDRDYAEFRVLLENKQLFVQIPLTDRKIPVILADEVDPSFGSGALKITPAHDLVDYNIFNKYLGGEFEQAINREGKLTAICGEFAGQKVQQARMGVIKQMVEQGFVPKKNNPQNQDSDPLKSGNKYFGIEFAQDIDPEQYQIDWNYEHNVAICERTKTVVEPLISEEFFISYHKEFCWKPIAKDDNITIANKNKVTNLQQLGIEAVNKTNFYSLEYKERGINFLENIKDWCISRDLIWGHKMPVWYNLDLNPDKIFYSYEQILEDISLTQHFQITPYKPDGNWVQEEKILDTWFSSCLWPLSTLRYTDFLKNKRKKSNLVFIHGGEIWQDKNIYLEKLEKGEINYFHYSSFFEDAVNSSKISWKTKLSDFCKNNQISLIKPQMPNKTNANYQEWKAVFEQSLPVMNSETILVGHSLGSMFLTRYLSESNLDCKAVFLVSGGLWTTQDLELQDFNHNWVPRENLENLNSKKTFIVHSSDDKVVPFSKSQDLVKMLPNANFVQLENQGHLNSISLELLELIQKELTNKSEFVIIHGAPETFIPNLSRSNFFTWLKNTLETQGHKVFTPELSRNNEPDYSTWKRDFENQVGKLNQNSIIVAHSAGGAFAVRYLSENPTKIKKLILLSPSHVKIPENKRLHELLDFEVNEVLKDLVGEIIVCTSDNDMEYRNQNIDFYVSKFNCRKHIFLGLGHFIKPEMNRREFPELLELLDVNIPTDFEVFYPTSTMTTGKDIFYQWIVRMTMLSYYFTAQIPYKHLVVTPTVLDDKGKKMSKSLGNGMDPVVQIEKYSSDALRLAMLGNMIPDRNIKMGGRIADELCEKYRNFGNKMWNIARFFQYQEEKQNNTTYL